jgi:putative aldouronate transport system permease protein
MQSDSPKIQLTNNTVISQSSIKNPNPKKIMFYLKRDWQLYVLLIFPLIAVIIFKYVPLTNLAIVFFDYDPIGGWANAKFIGLDVFKEVFKSKDFYNALSNTLLLNVLDLIVGFPMPIILAILINEVRHNSYKKITQTILYLPHFLSWVIIAGIFYQLLTPGTGLVNVLIERMGGQSIPFLTEKWHWLVSYNLIGVWQSMGWGSIIYLAAITGISEELYEAATVDGAGRWAKIWHITLPCLKSTIIILLILNLGRIIGISLERPFALGNPIVYDISNVFSIYILNVGLKAYRYNVAAVVGLFQSLVGLLLVLGTDRIAKRFGEDGLI